VRTSLEQISRVKRLKMLLLNEENEVRNESRALFMYDVIHGRRGMFTAVSLFMYDVLHRCVPCMCSMHVIHSLQSVRGTQQRGMFTAVSLFTNNGGGCTYPSGEVGEVET